MNLDFYIFQFINQFVGKNAILDKLGIFFASYFEYFLIVGLIIFLLKDFKKYLGIVVQALGAAVFSRFGITAIIRFLLPRARPFINNQVHLLISQDTASSFPSGHASFYFAISTIVYFYNKKIGILYFIATSLIVVSRVFVGVHWPSDILVGAIVGIFSGWLVNKIYKKFLQPKTPQ